MNNKKKLTVATALVTILSIFTAINPATLSAQDKDATDTTLIENTPFVQKEKAPALSLPENLQAVEGTPLTEIVLPQSWAWADGSTVVSTETTKYPAYITVDDDTYDYTTVAGYHAEGHYVDALLTVTTDTDKDTEKELPQPTSAEPVTSPLITTVPMTYSEGDVEINSENFPSEAFRKCLKESKKINPDGNDILSAEEVENVTEISVPSVIRENYGNMKGIELFPNLTFLECAYTGVQSLDVSKNTKLETLWCFESAITSLKIGENSNLKHIECNNNRNNNHGDGGRFGIESLDISGCPNLEYLDCNTNSMDSLDVSGCPNLKYLSYGGNSIDSLDISSCPNLEHLDCYGSSIQSLDVSGCPNLKDLSCGGNSIDSLDISSCPNLENLYCNGNKIRSLDVSGCPNLEYLECNNNSIQSLDVSGNNLLYFLDCGGNKIRSLDVSRNNLLLTLDCGSNPLTYLDIGINAGLSKLNYVDIDFDNTFVVSGKDTFNIQDAFPGIDKKKVSFKSGANYDSDTGVVSGYRQPTSVLVYEYDCGTAKGKKVIMQSTIRLLGMKNNSSIEIKESLHKIYDGKSVIENPHVDTSGSKAI